MTDTNTIEIRGFPAVRLVAAREALAAAHAKLVKAALKVGATAPEAPALVVKTERAVNRCSRCKRWGGDADAWKSAPVDSLAYKWGANPLCDPMGFGGFDEAGSCFGHMVRVEVVDLEVTTGRPALAGWEFLAVVEPLDGGNLVKRVPGSDMEFDLSAYRTGDALSCDHCATKRDRLETFVVKSDGSDPLVEAGIVKRVGRNCLSAFLGGLSASAVLGRMGFRDVVLAAGEGGEEGGEGWPKGPGAYNPVELLTWTVSVIGKAGWTSRGAARAYNEAGGNKSATADIVLGLMNPPFGAAAIAEWRKDREHFKPVDADGVKAAAVLEWARALAGTSDYEASLSLVAKQGGTRAEHVGILVSAVSGYDRFMGKAERERTEAATKIAAPVGKGIEFEGEIISVKAYTSDWGESLKMTVKVTTDAGIWMAWGTAPASIAEDVEVGRRVSVKATLEAGRDPHFVFAKRPSACFCDIYGPVWEPPKPPTKAKVIRAFAKNMAGIA